MLCSLLPAPALILMSTHAASHCRYDESALGGAIATSNADRSKLWIQTKIHPRDFGEKATAAAFSDSQTNLMTQSVDALLLHYPACWGTLCDSPPRVEPKAGWREAWYIRMIIQYV